MPRPDHRRDHYSAPEVAELLQVDAKTIHNWQNKGSLEGFRTPGNHLRFKREEIIAFMKRNKYPIPKDLEQPTAAAP
jgi:excisionase family DNA binding protein